MKIIGINGSPRAKGNTRLALDTMGEVFAQEGVEFDILHIGHKLSPCSGCFRCAKTHTCTLPDDGLNAMYEQLIQADGIVLASPVYFASVTSGMRCFLDRIGCIDMNNGRKLRMKVGVPVAVARRAGAVNAVDTTSTTPRCSSPVPSTGPWPLGRPLGKWPRMRRASRLSKC